jgi:serine/threonine protein kinase
MIVYQSKKSQVKLVKLDNKLRIIKTSFNRPDALNEVKILQSINHKHITQLLQVNTKNDDIVVSIFPYYSRGDLFDRIHKYNMPLDVKKTMRQLLSATTYLHERDIAHMDIKPENIMFDAENNVILIDFDLACFTSEYTSRGIKGTSEYLPPEHKISEKRDPKKQDIWCVGMVCYEMIFRNVTRPLRIEKVKEPYLRMFLKHALEPEPWLRATAHELLELLS